MIDTWALERFNILPKITQLISVSLIRGRLKSVCLTPKHMIVDAQVTLPSSWKIRVPLKKKSNKIGIWISFIAWYALILLLPSVSMDTGTCLLCAGRCGRKDAVWVRRPKSATHQSHDLLQVICLLFHLPHLYMGEINTTFPPSFQGCCQDLNKIL